MAISKVKKQEILGGLSDVAKNPSVVFVNFHGLPMAETIELRRALRSQGIGYVVAKKTLVRKAFSEAGLKGEIPTLDGELALAYGTDPLAPAREIYEFQKKFDKRISILGGVFQSEFRSQDEMLSIAQIPGEHALRGMFVNLLNSPIQGLVIALDAIAAKKTS